MTRRQGKARTAVIIALGAAALVLCAVWAKNQLAMRSDNKAAEVVVGQALIALKRNDAKALDRLLFTRNADHYFALHEPETLQLEIDNRRDYWGLQHIPDKSILRTVKAKRDVSRTLVGKILQLSAHEKMTGKWRTWSQDTPVLVTYSVRGVPMMSVALRENGVWKIDSIPCYMSTKVLRYGSPMDAYVAGDDPARNPYWKN
ncbi:MAG: hypothetical protein Q7T82_04220 [Armatimonadota bacterium]|nr:hypothetical protein [Armatimonadota bacterium]